MIELAGKERDIQKDVTAQTTALKDSIVDKLIPGKIWLLEKTQKLIEFFQGLVTHTRIVQEAMTNITRHAQASGVDVTLEYVDGQLRLRIRDDGCGFALDDTVRRAQGGSSLGVLGMQERATLIGGSLHIQTQPGQGSTVELVCPWRAQEEPA